MEKEKGERVYTTEELINLFRVSRFAITRAINSGKLKVERRGRSNYFTESAILEYLEQSKDK
jgi:hypothetical protein